MAYGQKINETSISFEDDLPENLEPLTVALMNQIQQQSKNSYYYNPSKCTSNSYFDVFYGDLPPVFVYEGELVLPSSTSTCFGDSQGYIDTDGQYVRLRLAAEVM